MNRARTLDSMYGTGITPDEAPTVERHVDGEDYSVDVDLTPTAGTLLEALAVAVVNHGARWAEWQMLGLNRSDDGKRRDLAVRELLGDPQVRQALTIRLTPDTAEVLQRQLDIAGLEPDRCDQYDHGDTCHNYTAEGETACPRHLPPDPQP